MQTREKGVEYLNGGGLRSTRRVAALAVANESRTYTTKSMFVSESLSSYGSVSSSTGSRCRPCDSPRRDARPEGNESRLITPTKVGASDVPVTSPSSFIVQRVERLYGPGALAQGFYTRRMTAATDRTEEVSRRREGDKAERSCELPVLRLLRPEFRAQLTLAARTSKSPARSPREEVAEGERPRAAQRSRTAAATPAAAADRVKDGHYYLKRLEEEVRSLEGLAAGGEEDLKRCESEEGAGILRAAAGKARLLVAQKLHQFRGLCTNNLKQTTSESFPTTDEDLAGFWDMVMIQVRQVHEEFDRINTLKANDWIQPEAGSKKSESGAAGGGGRKAVVNGAGRGKGGGGAGRKGGGEASRARDEARRRLIEEKRKAMRNSSALPSDDPRLLLL